MKSNPVLKQFQALNEIKKSVQESARLIEKYHMRGELEYDHYRVFNIDCEDVLCKLRTRMDRLSKQLNKEKQNE